ncbi:serine/threonine protein phosphatase 7 long form, partial [Trifolium pratense]
RKDVILRLKVVILFDSSFRFSGLHRHGFTNTFLLIVVDYNQIIMSSYPDPLNGSKRGIRVKCFYVRHTLDEMIVDQFGHVHVIGHSTTAEDMDVMFMQHVVHLIDLGLPVNDPSDCVDRYMKWFRRISHPYIISRDPNPTVTGSSILYRPIDHNTTIFLPNIAHFNKSPLIANTFSVNYDVDVTDDGIGSVASKEDRSNQFMDTEPSDNLRRSSVKDTDRAQNLERNDHVQGQTQPANYQHNPMVHRCIGYHRD